jgi:hypothetical protein
LTWIRENGDAFILREMFMVTSQREDGLQKTNASLFIAPEKLVIELFGETLVIRTDNQDSFQGPL